MELETREGISITNLNSKNRGTPTERRGGYKLRKNGLPHHSRLLTSGKSERTSRVKKRALVTAIRPKKKHDQNNSLKCRKEMGAFPQISLGPPKNPKGWGPLFKAVRLIGVKSWEKRGEMRLVQHTLESCNPSERRLRLGNQKASLTS